MSQESTRTESDPKTDDALECSECPWRGYERNAIRRDEPVEDWWFECPACGEVCAHLPLDELDPLPELDVPQTSTEPAGGEK